MYSVPPRQVFRECCQKLATAGIKLPSNLCGALRERHERTANRLWKCAQKQIDLLLAKPRNKPLDLSGSQLGGHRKRHLNSHAIGFFPGIKGVAQRQRGIAQEHFIRKKQRIESRIRLAEKILLTHDAEVRVASGFFIYELVQIVHRRNSVEPRRVKPKHRLI